MDTQLKLELNEETWTTLVDFSRVCNQTPAETAIAILQLTLVTFLKGQQSGLERAQEITR